VAVLKQRWLLALIALLLLTLIIWFAGPYVAFADFKPFESVVGRLVGILVLVVIWAIWLQLRALRTQRAGREFASAVAAQSDAPAVAGAAGESLDARALRERFASAMETLRQSRRGKGSLYDLPWYVIIGPPGSGKTTALVNSGLHFPLSQQFGSGGLRGVGGTRNCDWWFSDEAVLLDTAGRYTTQDSNAIADGAAWAEFLKLLRRYRGRRPINGVLVALSASDLLLLDERGRADHVAAVRRRIDELNRELKIRLPVYLLITKCDLVAGFIEYFDDLAREGRAQVWGTTFPIEVSERGGAAAVFEVEFDALVRRLNARLLTRIEADRDPRRRAAMLAFPQQFAGLKGALLSFVSETFGGSTTFDSTVLLRGVYFTSGTQESTPIDRMMGAIARSFGLESQLVAAPASAGRSYFIERLLKDVVVAEAGLAGVNRRLELRLHAVHYALYAACALLLVLGLAALFFSFRANRDYLADVGMALQMYQQTPAPAGPLTAADLPDALPRLDALRNVLDSADQYREHRPWGMRWGLYQGAAVGEAARDAYIRELSGSILPALAEQFRGDLSAAGADPERLYETLKAYLMLGDPSRLDADQMEFLADLQWRRLFPTQSQAREELRGHLTALLNDRGRLRPVAIDQALVARARDALKQASLPVLMYSRLKLAYAGDKKRAWRLDQAVGLGSDKVFVRRSGASLAEPVPALYTKPVFDEYQRTGKLALLKQFADDRWVFGDDAPSMQGMVGLTQQVNKLYEADYIRVWDALLADVHVRQTSGGRDLADLLLVLASPASPLKGFYVAVDKQTNLLKKDESPAASKVDAALGALGSKTSQLAQLFGADTSANDVDQPGTAVTMHFDAYHKLVDGSSGAAPIDHTLALLGQAQQQVDRASQAGGGSVGEIANAGQSEAIRALQAEASGLPPALADLVGQIGHRSETAVTTQAKSELARRYEEQVLRVCRDVVQGRYPFDAASAVDVPLADFGRLFGFGGIYDAFFRDTLASLVDTTRVPWRWREGAGEATGIPGVLERFQSAAAIRDTFFEAGSMQPELHFTLVADALDADVTRFALELDGQSFEYRHGPTRAMALRWPGGPAGQAAVTFESGSGPNANLPFDGPWAWFRLLGHAQIQSQSDVRYLITFGVGGKSARLQLDAATIRNPFAHADVLRFHCS
jgi:type VI secretion system protein ImpL